MCIALTDAVLLTYALALTNVNHATSGFIISNERSKQIFMFLFGQLLITDPCDDY